MMSRKRVAVCAVRRNTSELIQSAGAQAPGGPLVGKAGHVLGRPLDGGVI